MNPDKFRSEIKSTVSFLLPERLKHQTKMLLVVEVPEEAKAVELVIRICVIQLLEELQLLQPGLLPVDEKSYMLNNANSIKHHYDRSIYTCLYFDMAGEMCSVPVKRYDSHELIVSDDLDCHLLAGPGSVPGSDHVAEDTLAGVAVHIIALVQCLPDVHP